MDFDKLRMPPAMTQEEFDSIKEGILALAPGETKHYTWEEKIDNLAKLAKAAGSYINSRDELGSDYNNEAMFNLRETYEEFCRWRHEEPYVVDEIKELLVKGKPEVEVEEQGPFSREKQIEWQEKHRAEAEESHETLSRYHRDFLAV